MQLHGLPHAGEAQSSANDRADVTAALERLEHERQVAGRNAHAAIAHLQPNGIYLCEDIHTSYVDRYGGGYRRPGTFLEYSKGLVDRLYAWYSEQPEVFPVDDLTRSTYALHFYDSVLVIEKRPIEAPRQSKTGRQSF